MDRSKRTTLGLTIVALVTLVWALVAGYLWHRDSAELARMKEADFAINGLRESALHGLVSLDHEGLVIEWNPAMVKLTGYTQAEMTGKTLEAVMRPADWQRHTAAFEEHMRRAIEVQRMEKPWPVLEIPPPVFCELLHKDPERPATLIRASIRVFIPEPETGRRPYAIGFCEPDWAIPETLLPEAENTARVRARAKMRRG